MTDAAMPAWPVKSREMLTHHLDSTIWNRFALRSGDIIIATYAKSGTTWTQQIVSQLIFGGAEGIRIHDLSPWLDLRILLPEALAALEAQQQHRRFIKSHLPADAVVISPDVRYIYIGRDGRDTAWSFHNHHYNANDDYFARLNAGLPPGFPVLERGPADPRDFYLAWLNGNGFPLWPYWDNVRTWWNIRHLPNVLLVHFNDMKADLEGVIRRVAGFLDYTIDADQMPRILEHCSFDYMKAHGAETVPRGGQSWKEGAATFLHKGTNGRWRDVLSAAEIEEYEARAIKELGPDCARWLANGGAQGVPPGLHPYPKELEREVATEALAAKSR